MKFESLSPRMIAAGFLAVFAAASGAQLSVPSAILPERVEAAARDRIAAGTYQTLVIAMVDGNTSAVRVFGTLDGGKAPDGDSVFEIGSITKTFTATLLADAVQSGRVTLDTPLQALLPGFKIPDRAGKQITLELLATQHSGLPRLPSNLQPRDPANPYADYDAAKLREFLASYVLPRDPGQSYEYSNLGFGLLGYALASSAHTSYGALVEQKIFKPLGMTMSGTAFTPSMRAHLAAGHDEAGKSVENWDMDALAGAGAIRSTGNDMLRYLKANMGVEHGAVNSAMKLAQTPLADMDKHSRIGLAWMTTDEGVTWHNGATAGYRSFIGWSADQQHGVVVLTNSAVDVEDLGFATVLADAPLAATHKAIAVSGNSLEAYTGTYQFSEQFLIKVFRANDQLMVQATGQGPFVIHPSAPNEFFANIGGIAFTFMRDTKGSVTGLVLHQNGDHAAVKLSAAALPAEPKEIAVDVTMLRAYVGQYRFDSGAMLDVTLHDGQLEASLGGQPSFSVYPSAKDKFFLKVVDAQLEFKRDAQGNVVAVVLHQNGHDQRANHVTL